MKFPCIPSKPSEPVNQIRKMISLMKRRALVNFSKPSKPIWYNCKLEIGSVAAEILMTHCQHWVCIVGSIAYFERKPIWK